MTFPTIATPVLGTAGACATASQTAPLHPGGSVAACQGDWGHLSSFLLTGSLCCQGSNPKSRWTGCSRGSHAPSTLANWAATLCQTHLLLVDKRGVGLCSCSNANTPQDLQGCLLSLCPAPNRRPIPARIFSVNYCLSSLEDELPLATISTVLEHH